MVNTNCQFSDVNERMSIKEVSHTGRSTPNGGFSGFGSGLPTERSGAASIIDDGSSIPMITGCPAFARLVSAYRERSINSRVMHSSKMYVTLRGGRGASLSSSSSFVILPGSCEARWEVPRRVSLLDGPASCSGSGGARDGSSGCVLGTKSGRGDDNRAAG